LSNQENFISIINATGISQSRWLNITTLETR